MCRETIGIALCAPASAPFLSFTCGRLHNIATLRETCDEAKGSCPCFFGTCGCIDTIASSHAVDSTAISKVRCHECTSREDETGFRREGRDLAESPILNRVPIPEECLGVHMNVLKTLWKGADKCNIHDLGSTQDEKAPSVHKHEDLKSGQQSPSAPLSEEKKSRASSRTSEKSDKSIKDIAKHLTTSGIAPHLGIHSSRWAEVPNAAQGHSNSVSKERCSSQAPSVVSIHSSQSQTAADECPTTEPIDSVFELKNLPETLPNFAAMKAFLARA